MSTEARRARGRKYYAENREKRRAYARKYYLDHRERLNDKDRRNEWRWDWADRNPEKALLKCARTRAKARGVEFDIGVSDISVPELCPVLGIKLKHNRGRWQDDSPTIDRIDNSKGYVRGNVCVVSYRANRLKSDGTAEEFHRISEFLKARM